MAMRNHDETYFSLGNFPLAPRRLDSLRATLAQDLLLLENLNLASITSERLLEVVKTAAMAKTMHSALSGDALPIMRETALLNGGVLNWSDAISILLLRQPESAAVNLNLGSCRCNFPTAASAVLQFPDKINAAFNLY